MNLPNFQLLDARQRLPDGGEYSPRLHIPDEKVLLETINRLTSRCESYFFFDAPNGNQLLILTKNELAFVEFTGLSRLPPYLYATRIVDDLSGSDSTSSNDYLAVPLFDFVEKPSEKNVSQSRRQTYVEFNVQGTPTSIAISKCVTVQDMTNIVIHFFRYQELSSEFDWRSD